MPTNLYGPGDNYHPENSHVIPALIRRFHDAKVTDASVVHVWGSGLAKRDFLFVEDMAEACVFIQNLPSEQYKKHTNDMLSQINIGSGRDITIKNLAQIIKSIVGFKGDIKFDEAKPDGTPRKILNTGLLSMLGWKPKTSLEEGLSITYQEFLQNFKRVK